MAIDMCSENLPLITSPRISFSHDLRHMDDIETMEDNAYRADSSLMDSNSDQFDFSFSYYIQNEPSSAEELFSDGLIRPLQLYQKLGNPKHPSLPPLPNPPTYECSKQDSSSKEIIISTSAIEPEQKQQSKSFWRIKRSSSVHCDNSHKKSSFWSLPLLLRSNSTGSVPSSRQMLKDNQKQNSQKQTKNSSSASSSSSYYVYQLSQKPPLKKNYGGAYGNGVWISPVLNMPPPYIAKGTANLFGLNYLFRDKKDKKNKK